MFALKAFQYFSVAGFINALLLSSLLLFNRKNHLAKVFMVILVLLVTFQTILNAYDTREFFMTFPHLSKISWLIPSLFGPLVYLFTVKLCQVKPSLTRTDLLHFVPFLVYLVILIPWYIQPAEFKRSYFNNFELAQSDDFGILNQVSIILILLYLVMTLVFLANFRKQIRNTFSEISQKRLEWMSTFAYGVAAVLIISSLGFYGHKWNIRPLDAIYHYNYIALVLLVYWIGYKSLLQPVIFDFPAIQPGEFKELPEESEINSKETTAKYVRSGLPDEQAEDLYKVLIGYMKTEKPFLNPEINIFELASTMNVRKHHLSQVINEKAGMNFFDFINSFRVEEVKKNLVNGKKSNMTLLGIALESGFNSKATFNSAFKKLTGQTPSEYIATQDRHGSAG